MEYIIDRLPMPTTGIRNRKSAWSQYPFEKMEIGDHTVLNPETMPHSVVSFRASLFSRYKKTNKRFATLIDKKTGLLHIWRVA
jgi:hypothetical protein